MNPQRDLPLVKRIYVYRNTVHNAWYMTLYKHWCCRKRYPTGKASIPMQIRSIARECSVAFHHALRWGLKHLHKGKKARWGGGGCNVTVTVPPKDRGTRWHRSWQRGQPSLPHESSAQDKSKMQNPMISHEICMIQWFSKQLILKQWVLRDGLVWEKIFGDIKTLKFHKVSRMLLEKSIGWGCATEIWNLASPDFAKNSCTKISKSRFRDFELVSGVGAVFPLSKITFLM